MAPLAFVFLADLQQVHLFSAFVLADIILPLILPFVSPDPVMGVIFSQCIDWVCPLISFSEVEAPTEALAYLKWGRMPPPPYPHNMYLGLRERKGWVQSWREKELVSSGPTRWDTFKI